jgi:hypothetical protein
MAIQTRRGNEVDFDASKMLPGEWAVSLDTKYVRMCFSPGLVYRMATYESFEEDMQQIQQILATCEDIQTAVEAFEELAEQHANDAAASATASANSATASANSATASANSAILSDSWAEGGTGIRPGEDTNNAKYWAGVAQSVADIQIATNDTVGIVKGNEGEINIDIGGQMSIPSDFAPQTTLEAVTGTEDKKTFFGKVAKVITDFLSHVANTSIHFGLTNNLLATVAGTALDAVQGKALDDKITTINQNLGFNTTEHLAGFYNGKQLYAKTVIVTKAVSATWQNIYTESAATLVLVDYGKSYVHDTTNGFFMLLESKEGSGVISRCSGKIVQCYGFVSATYEFILSIMYTKN